MKKIMLSALAAVLSFGCFQNADALRGASRGVVQQPAAPAPTPAAPAPAATPAPAQQYTPAAQTPAKLDAAAKTEIVDYINTECAFKNVSGWPLNLKNHFRKLAKAIQSNNTVEMQNSLSKIATFNTKKQWNNEKVQPVRKTVLQYFRDHSSFYGANLVGVAETALAD